MAGLFRYLSIAAAMAILGGDLPAFAAQPAVDFLRDVKPILAQRCFRCHSSLEQEANLRLDGVPAILKGGDGGPTVVPGKSGESRLIEAIEQRGDLKMPPEGEPLTQSQIATIKAWIDAGAPAPAEGVATQVDHWAFEAPVRPAVPTPADPAWSTNPIDALIAAKHAELKLAPVAEAPPNLLLRRLSIDLTGLPPTPEELHIFQTSQYEAAVDQLLASPAYGERWGRHWMDVWRYSDWDGYGNEVRESKPHIWRWRDWIVESLNADKPYDRMVQEMLAADELSPEDSEALPATGYLVRSWYKFSRNKWLDDAVEHTGKAFLGVTFNCARCHDHMYDPVEQREYYALRAFFEPYDIRTDRLPGEADTNKSGLVRVFDAKAETPTFVFVRGNDKQPLKDEPVAPAFPKALHGASCSIEPVALPQTASYPGLAEFVRDETLATAKQVLEKAKAAFGTAETKLTEAFRSAEEPLPTPDASPQPPAPSPSLHDADAQFALARAALAAAEAGLAFNEARLAADRANYAVPLAAGANELSLATAAIERVFNRLQAEKGLLQAEINVVAAERAKKPTDTKTANAVTAAQTALNNAMKARADAANALEEPAKDYTRFTPTYPATSTGRRLALARWITSRDNPLAARVAINHIWLRHFGSPLVPSVFDFGLNGKPPTNQPLLDWLAIELMESGWRMKHIHKLIATSRTYRLASSAGHVQGSIDPENLYYWRANPRRMEAEAVRDATLLVAGSLDQSRGGPELDQNQGLAVPRRSLYFRASKEKKMEFLSLFDSANPVECYRRSESIAPQQALALANSTLSLAQSRLLAKQLTDSLGNDSKYEAAPRFVGAAFVRILCREPTADERAACLAFLTEQSQALTDTSALTPFSAGPAATVPPSTDPQQRARENLVHVLFNHNDFVTVR